MWKGAFQCEKCPRSADPQAERSCPAWWTLMLKQEVTGAEKVEQNCAFLLMPTFLSETMRMSHRAAANSVQTRQDTLNALEHYHVPPLPARRPLTTVDEYEQPRRIAADPGPVGRRHFEVESAGDPVRQLGLDLEPPPV